MSDLFAELAKMTTGQWVADLATMAAMGLGILAVWLVWVRPFDARVAREMAEARERAELGGAREMPRVDVADLTRMRAIRQGSKHSGTA